MIGDDQRMRPHRFALDPYPCAEDPGNSGKETARPGRSPNQRLRQQMNWRDESEQAECSRDPG